jgi:dCTP deaminase
MVLADHEIKRLCRQFGMISPFTSRMVKKKKNGQPCLGYGLDSAGYDLRLADSVRVFTDHFQPGMMFIDPKTFDEGHLETKVADENGRILLPPKTTALGKAMEHIKLPNNVVALAGVKSTYARAGITLNFTKFVPGWEGDLVIEISNMTTKPVAIYPGEGIMSVVFCWVNPPDALYAARGGSYHKQTGVTLPKA